MNINTVVEHLFEASRNSDRPRAELAELAHALLPIIEYFGTDAFGKAVALASKRLERE